MDRVRFADGVYGIHNDPAIVPSAEVGNSGGEIVFVDPGIQDLQAILNGVRPGVQVVMLDGARDPLDQIASVLAGLQNLSAIHIVTDGSEGEIRFSAGALGLGDLGTKAHAADLAAIGSALGPDGDLLLWGCDIGKGGSGAAFLSALAHATGADVAASTDLTGSSALGGNWDLESSTGPVQSGTPFTPATLSSFDAVLASQFDVPIPAGKQNATDAHVTQLTGGGFIVAYQTQATANSFYLDINAQLYDSSGTAVGSPISLTSVDPSQSADYNLNIRALPNGGAVIVWARLDQVGLNDFDVYARVVTATGAPDTTVHGGAAFAISATGMTGGVFHTEDVPAVGVFSNGGFVTVWREMLDFNSNNSEIWALRTDASGTNGSKFLVNTATANEQDEPQVAVLSDGGFLVAWRTDVTAGSFSWNVLAQRYNASGQAVHSNGTTLGAQEFLLSTTTADNQENPTLTALSGGGWVATWSSNNQLAGQGTDIFARVFSSTGVGGSEIQVDTLTTGVDDGPSIVTLPDGGFLITWRSAATDSQGDIHAQRFDSTGTKIGSEFLVNNVTTGPQSATTQSMAVIAGSGQHIAETWYDTTGSHIHAVVYTIHSAPSGADITKAINEDTARSFTAADFTAGFTDSAFDSPADTLAGVKVTSLPAGGTLTLSGGAVSVGQVISLANIPNLLFTPTSNLNGTGAGHLTFQVQDNGGTATGSIDLDPTANTYTFDITAVNDAPIASGSASLTSIAEDASNPAGATVASLYGSNFSDAADQVSGGSSANTLAGVAVTANAETSQGHWQYFHGGVWTNVGTLVSAASALILSTSDSLRFLPAADFNGTTPALTVHLIDNSSGAVTGGATANVSSSGGTTPYSAGTVALTQTVTAANDAPVASGTATLAAVNEDTANPPGATVSSIFTANFSDAADQVSGGSSANTFVGVAVTANAETSEGHWQYFHGGVWTNVGTSVSNASALILAVADSLRFVPVANFDGAAPALTVHLIDNSGGAVTGGTTANVSVNGGTTQYSAATVAMGETITAVNDAPTTAGGGNTVGYTEQAAGVVIDSGLTVADIDNANLASATVVISAGFQSGDTLNFVNQNGISGSYNAGTQTLTLTGSSSVANYQTALQSVTFSNATNDNPSGSRTVTWTVDDGQASNHASNTQTSTINITGVNDAPTLGGAGNAVGYTEQAAAIVVDNGLTVGDPDSTNLTGATVTISANLQTGDTLHFTNQLGISFVSYAGGVLTLSGTTTLANYQTALRTVTFDNTTNDDPTAGGAAATRTIAWVGNDGAGANDLSTGVTTTINITAVDDAAVAKNDAFTVAANAALGAGQNLFNNNGPGADSDPDSAFVVATVNGSAGNVGSQITLASGALLTVNANGTFSYDPNHKFDTLAVSGSGASDTTGSDSFTYTITGGSSATVNITVNGVDNASTVYVGTGGADTITGGNSGNIFDLTGGGNDTATGGSGNDGFKLGGAFTPADRIDGGAGTNDQMQLDGVYGGTISLDGTAIKNIEVIALGPTHDYTVAADGTLTTAGQMFTFWAVSMAAPHFANLDMHLEAGNFRFFLGQGDDTAKGGTGTNLFYGEGGADTLTGNTGVDTFAYLQVTDSHGNANGTAYDTIAGFAAGTDKFKLAGLSVIAVDGTLAGSLSSGSFESDLSTAFGPATANELAAAHAVIFHVTGGGLNGHDFLIVNAHGSAGYSTGADYVFDVTGGTLAGLGVSDFA